MIDTAEYVKLLIALLAIIDVPGNIPIFLQQTGHMKGRDKLVTALVAAVTTLSILVVFALFGEVVLSTFGITIAAFKILGGLVVVLIALDMLGLLGGSDAGDQSAKQTTSHSPAMIGVFPLAVPLFAGPGAITAVMVYAHDDHHSVHQVISHDLLVLAVITSACAVLALGLIAASGLGRFIGPLSQVVLNRLLGMLVGALGVEFILEGISAFFPGLGA